MTFLSEINSFHDTIKFTAEWSRSSVTFLDTKVSIEGRRLVSDLYTKPTDSHQYFHHSSCHPRHCKTGIAFSQALRLKRICTNNEDYLQHVRELKGYLVQRGYSEEEVQSQLNRVADIDRRDLLISVEKKKKHATPLIVTYHPDLPPLNSVLRRHQCLIDLSPRLKGALPEPPLVAYRRPPKSEECSS